MALARATEYTYEWLVEHGYDGLACRGEDCGCGLDDLAPCGAVSELCRPGRNDPEAAKAYGEDFWITADVQVSYQGAVLRSDCAGCDSEPKP